MGRLIHLVNLVQLDLESYKRHTFRCEGIYIWFELMGGGWGDSACPECNRHHPMGWAESKGDKENGSWRSDCVLFGLL